MFSPIIRRRRQHYTGPSLILYALFSTVYHTFDPVWFDVGDNLFSRDTIYWCSMYTTSDLIWRLSSQTTVRALHCGLVAVVHRRRALITTRKCGVVMRSVGSVCMSASLCVCNECSTFRKPWPRKFIFGVQVGLSSESSGQVRTPRSSGQGQGRRKSVCGYPVRRWSAFDWKAILLSERWLLVSIQWSSYAETLRQWRIQMRSPYDMLNKTIISPANEAW